MLQPDPDRPTGLREANIAARRERVLEAARNIITDGGMQALSMRKLAQAAGLSVTTLYNLFGARDDILIALVHDAIDRMDQILEREAPLDDPIERCRAVITVSVAYVVEHEAIFRPMVVTVTQGLSRELYDRSGMLERASGMQRVAIEAAIERGLLRDLLDPRTLSEQIYHGYEMACDQWAFGVIDEVTFRARALYGLYVALLAVTSDELRPDLEAELRKLEKELDDARPS